MLTKKVETAINAQVAAEFYAAHLYLSMAAFFEVASLPGFAKWMRMQHQEEMAHGMRLFDFVLNNGGVVTLSGVKQPPTTFTGPLQVMALALKHEKSVTASINKLYELALKEKDYPTQVEMQWFINEQTEEERTFSDNIARLKLAGDNGAALLMIDSEFGTRSTAAI
jgi:ferritin